VPRYIAPPGAVLSQHRSVATYDKGTGEITMIDIIWQGGCDRLCRPALGAASFILSMTPTLMAAMI